MNRREREKEKKIIIIRRRQKKRTFDPFIGEILEKPTRRDDKTPGSNPGAQDNEETSVLKELSDPFALLFALSFFFSPFPFLFLHTRTHTHTQYQSYGRWLTRKQKKNGKI